MLFVRLRVFGSGATESPDSRSSLVVILISSFFGSAALFVTDWEFEIVDTLGFGAGCWFAKLRTISLPGLDLPSLAASDGTTRGLDHKPADGEETPLSLRLLGVYREFEPELAVLRTPLEFPSQLLYDASSVKGESLGVLNPDELPVKRLL